MNPSTYDTIFTDHPFLIKANYTNTIVSCKKIFTDIIAQTSSNKLKLLLKADTSIDKKYKLYTSIKNNIDLSCSKCNTFLKKQSNGIIRPNIPFSGYTPAQIRTVYGMNTTPISTYSGQNSKIAIIIAYRYSNLQSDLDIYCDTFSIPRKQLIICPMGPNIRIDNDWGSECCLDTQMIVMMAPASDVYVVQAKSPSMQDMMSAVKYANDTIKADVVSMSWGCREYSGIQSLSSTYFSNNKISYVASSGDDNYVSFPASSHNILSIGGTSITLDSNYLRVNEMTWSKAGSGTSRYFSKPSYQNNIVSGSFRSTPDISCVANPYTGVQVYCSAYGGWQIYGGTSVSAPITAGFLAVVCGYRNNNNLSKITTVGPNNIQNTLYQTLYKNPNTYSQCFYDVTQGRDGTLAKTGYDCMGIGVCMFETLFSKLIT